MEDFKTELNFIDIIQRLAIVIEGVSGKPPYEKQIAYELGLSASQFSNNKKRNKIPFEEITFFCEKNGITINWMLLGKSGKDLIEKEEEFHKIRIIEKINKSAALLK